ncbi:class I SAM-dependent methyltransferase [Stratiformator vulcanicus]|uniref:Ubiquinone biosynthesis O-methyltransferase n=1 Tax=Stratiformator vulcanicus TaxID=2527980 RepID=A0A517QY90_9PLAN|nr:class I SAM-dependent methyltransferase [Stratiformator vulcanicus]QDT36597.1 Ubiquinone biosynthesis O-methyltransferase [Stratiformator vulcanicus]
MTTELEVRPEEQQWVDRGCVCCGQIDWRKRWEEFIVCQHCGVMTVQKCYSPEELTAFYQEEYFNGEEYIDYVADKPAQLKTLRDHLSVIQKYVPPGRSVLEVGCAYRFFLELLAADYPQSTGIDVSAPGIEHAARQGLDARLGDLLTMSFDKEFDAVCMWDTIEHLPNPGEYVSACAQALAPGGHLFLSTGDFNALLPRLQGRKWRQIHPLTHLYYFTRKSLSEICRRNGLDVISFGTVRVHRKLGSSLEALHRFHGQSLSGRAASLCRSVIPNFVQNFSFPLDLRDTLWLAARKL